MMARGRVAVLVAVMTALPGWPAARAQSVDRPAARAKAHYERGVAAYDSGQYDRAIQAFTSAHALDPAPVLLYNVAQSYRKKGEAASALVFYRRYLEAAPAAEDRPQVEARIRELETAVQASAAPSPPVPAIKEWQPPVEPVAGDANPPPFAAPPLVAAGSERPAIYERPWFWGAIGAAGVATAVAAIFLLRPRDLWSCHPTECVNTRTVP